MPYSRKILGLFVILFFLTCTVNAVKTVNCECDCASPDGTIQLKANSTTDTNCIDVCAGKCGGYTGCTGDENPCRDCCETYCTQGGNSFSGSDSAVARCKQSCEGKCNYYKTIIDIKDAFIYVAIFIAALVFAYCGIKFITAESTESKAEAKKCLIYVVAGLIVIGMATYLVDLIFS